MHGLIRTISRCISWTRCKIDSKEKDGITFFDGYSGSNQISSAPKDQEKTTFTYPYWTFTFKRMHFGLCNSPTTFLRYMMSIFSDIVTKLLRFLWITFQLLTNPFISV